LLLAPEELFAFLQQGGLSMAIQRGGTFQKGFWHLAALLDPR
jgi:hypothetical protein